MLCHKQESEIGLYSFLRSFTNSRLLRFSRISQSLGLLKIFVHISWILFSQLSPNCSLLEISKGLQPDTLFIFVSNQNIQPKAFLSKRQFTNFCFKLNCENKPKFLTRKVTLSSILKAWIIPILFCCSFIDCDITVDFLNFFSLERLKSDIWTRRWVLSMT